MILKYHGRMFMIQMPHGMSWIIQGATTGPMLPGQRASERKEWRWWMILIIRMMILMAPNIFEQVNYFK